MSLSLHHIVRYARLVLLHFMLLGMPGYLFSQSPVAKCKSTTLYLDQTGNINLLPSDIDSFSTGTGISLSIDRSTFSCADTGMFPSLRNVVIAKTSFEDPDTGGMYFDVNGLSTVDHDLINNPGQANVDFNGSAAEMGFDAYYYNTRNNVGLTDGDFVGVTAFQGVTGPFPDGNRGYQISDPDGMMTLTFDTVNLSGYQNVNLSLDYFIQFTGYEANDTFRIAFSLDGGAPVTALEYLETDLESYSNSWRSFNYNLSGFNTAAMIISFDGNAAVESIFLDDVRFTGDTMYLGNPVTLTVTDTSGNSDACISSVMVLDSIKPIPTCPVDTYIGCNPNPLAIPNVNTSLVSTTDNCGGVNVSHVGDQVITLGCATYLTRTYKANDASGNSSTCQQEISWIIDNFAPMFITTLPDVSLNCITDPIPPPNTSGFFAWDNCTLDTLYHVSDVSNSGSGKAGDPIIISRTYRAEDECGNTTDHVHLISIEDTSAPVITCPADITVNADTASCNALVNYSLNVTDNCSIYSLQQDSGLASGAIFPKGITLNAFTAEDSVGNTASCSFNVMVEDNSPPIVSCIDITVQPSLSNADTIVYTQVTTSVVDHCAVNSVTLSQDIFSCSNSGVFPVVVMASDVSGNNDSCTAMVTVSSTNCCVADSSFIDANLCSKTIFEFGDSIFLPPGLHVFNYLNQAGCDSVIVVDVDTNSSPVVSVTPSLYAGGFNISCAGADDAFITAIASGGLPPYQFMWNNSDTAAFIDSLVPQNYEVIIEDANGCTDTASTAITEPDSLVVSIDSVSDYSGFNISCAGLSDGYARMKTDGGVPPYTYAWDVGGNSNEITNMGFGIYNVTVTDNNSCTDDEAVPLVEPAALSGDAVHTRRFRGQPLQCNGDQNARAGVLLSGGAPPYNYSWNISGSNYKTGFVGAGLYWVTVTDNNGCSISDSVTIFEPPAIQTDKFILSRLIYNGADVRCYGDQNAWVDFSIAGGQPVPGNFIGYRVRWSNGAKTEDLAAVGAGTYTVTVTDFLGCQVYDTVTITEPDSISASMLITDDSCSSAIGQIVIAAAGGVGGFNYNWSNGASTATISNLPGGTYSVGVSDRNGCFKDYVAIVADSCGVQKFTSINHFVSNDASINVYPNPTSGQCSIQIEGIDQPSTICLMDLQGKTIQEMVANEGSMDIDLTDLSASTYILQLNTEQGSQTVRIVKTP